MPDDIKVPRFSVLSGGTSLQHVQAQAGAAALPPPPRTDVSKAYFFPFLSSFILNEEKRKYTHSEYPPHKEKALLLARERL